MKNSIQIGNISFNISAVKKMKLAEFEKTYKPFFQGQDMDKIYNRVIKSYIEK